MIIEHRFCKPWLGILASIFLGMTFVVAGISKFYAPVKEFELLTLLDFLPDALAGAINIWLMPLELAIGLFLVVSIAVKFVACLSLVFIACFIASNILMIILELENCLSCFGKLGELTAVQALWFDGVMVALVVVILFLYPGKFFNKRPWYWGK